MDWKLGLVVAAIAIVALVFRASSGSKVPRDQLAALLAEDDALVVDVRTPAEFGRGHVSGAVNIPISDLESRMSELLPKQRPVLLYCASGMRSEMAKRQLEKSGFERAFNVGTMSAFPR